MYVVVAFKVSSSKSVLYKQTDFIEKVSQLVEEAFLVKDADFISIRKVKGGKHE